jgi:hypothetical protein
MCPSAARCLAHLDAQRYVSYPTCHPCLLVSRIADQCREGSAQALSVDLGDDAKQIQERRSRRPTPTLSARTPPPRTRAAPATTQTPTQVTPPRPRWPRRRQRPDHGQGYPDRGPTTGPRATTRRDESAGPGSCFGARAGAYAVKPDTPELDGDQHSRLTGTALLLLTEAADAAKSLCKGARAAASQIQSGACAFACLGEPRCRPRDTRDSAPPQRTALSPPGRSPGPGEHAWGTSEPYRVRLSSPKPSFCWPFVDGANRDRSGDLLLAK